jgi:ribose transport system ATP-binding protein
MSHAARLLTVSELWKSYSAVALAGVGYDLDSGEVHAVVGENGAGKSTLARIIAGLTKPDSGELRLAGQPYAPRNKVEAERHGVRMVMQELNLIGNLTVAESLFLDKMPHRFGWINYRQMNFRAGQVLAQVGLGELAPTRLIKTLGIGQQQLVEIATGISRQCRLLILDEPTAALTDPEINRLFDQIAQLKARGVGIIYISHRLEEIQRIADRVTVLRDGKIIGTYQAQELPLAQIVRLMVGRELDQVIHRPAKAPGDLAMRVSRLQRGAAVRDVSFELRRGEILGFAGLMGSGRTETMRAIFGADRPDNGQIFLHGSTAPAKIRTPHDAVRQGIALLTEDRKEQGLLLPLPIRLNITLTHLWPLSRWGGWIQAAAERSAAAQWIKALDVRCASCQQNAAELSGGNQQKVVIAKWLYRNCDILIFDEPTRGIDVGAKFEVYQCLVNLAE